MLSLLAAAFLQIAQVTTSSPAFTGTDADFSFGPSLGSLGPIGTSGQIDIPGRGPLVFNEGDLPIDVLTFGDVDGFGLEGLTLNHINEFTGTNFSGLTLEDVPLLANSSLNDVADAVGNDPEFLDNILIDNRTVERAIADGDGDKTLAETLGIDKEIEEINKIKDTVLSELEDFRNTVLSEIPGLSLLPFAQFPAQILNSNIAAAAITAKFDLPFGPADQGIDNTVTGGELDGFNVPCPPLFPCAHIELQDGVSVGLEGKRWIWGEHRVRGGSGILCLPFDCTEPTGRMLLGPGTPAKIVLEEVDEGGESGVEQARFALYFNVCEFLLGCTGHNIGPFPFYTARRTGDDNPNVLMGFNVADLGNFRIPLNQNLGTGIPGGSNAPADFREVAAGPNATGQPNECNQQQGNIIYENPAAGTFTSGFGPRGSRFHEGIDIANNFGTPIIAGEGARVDFIGFLDGYGLTVDLREACNGYILRYAHNQRVNVRVGQDVQRGQQIAEMGSTGRSTGPHTHFEVRVSAFGTALNPARFLRL